MLSYGYRLRDLWNMSFEMSIDDPKNFELNQVRRYLFQISQLYYKPISRFFNGYLTMGLRFSLIKFD